MAGNVPNISRDSFVFSKLYDKVTLQQGVPITDSDWNELADVLRATGLLLGVYALEDGVFGPTIGVDADPGYQIAEATSASNNFEIGAGWALVKGALVPTTMAEPPVDHDYTDDTNLMGEGTVSSTGSGGTGTTIVDVDKYWETYHSLAGCQLKMTSGTESGNTFEILSRTNNTTFELTTVEAGISATDTYIIKPPALTTPGGARTDEVYLMVWWEDINENEDANVEHPGLSIETAHRSQLRWCVRVAENGTTPVTSSAQSFGPRYLKIAELGRTASADVLTAQITNEARLPKGNVYADILRVSSGASQGVGTDLVPDTDSAYDLGTDAVRWKDLYLDGLVAAEAKSDLNPDTDNTYTLGESGATWASAFINALSVSSVENPYGAYIQTTGFQPTSDNTSDLGASTKAYQDIFSYTVNTDSLSTRLPAGTTVNIGAHLIPSVDNTRDLGSDSYRYKDLYIAGDLNAETPADNLGGFWHVERFGVGDMLWYDNSATPGEELILPTFYNAQHSGIPGIGLVNDVDKVYASRVLGYPYELDSNVTLILEVFVTLQADVATDIKCGATIALTGNHESPSFGSLHTVTHATGGIQYQNVHKLVFNFTASTYVSGSPPYVFTAKVERATGPSIDILGMALKFRSRYPQQMFTSYPSEG